MSPVIRNAAALYAAEFFGRGAQFALYIVAARVLAPADFGTLSFAFTLFTLSSIVSDFGLLQLVTKKVARSGILEAGSHAPLFWAATLVRALVTLVTVGGVLVYLRLSDISPEGLLFMAILGGALFMTAPMMPLVAVLRGLNRMRTEAVVRITTSILASLSSLAAILAGYGLAEVAIAQAAGLILGGAVMVALGIRMGVVRAVRPGPLPEILRAAAPFGFQAITVIISLRVGHLLLLNFRGAEEFATFSAAYRLVEPLYLVPGIFAAALFPTLSSSLASRDTGNAARLSEFTIACFFSVALPVAIALSYAAPLVIRTLYPDEIYLRSIPVLRIISWALLATFITATTAAVINASRRPETNTYIAMGMLAVNIVLCITLVPAHGATGLAIASLSIEYVGLLAGGIYIVRHVMKLNFAQVLARPVFCTAVASLPLLLDTPWALLSFATVYPFLLLYLPIGRFRKAFSTQPAEVAQEKTTPTGLVWAGPVYDRGGYGNVARNYILGIRRAGFPVRVVDYAGRQHQGELDPDLLALLRELESVDVGTNPALVVHHEVGKFGGARARGFAWTIGCTIFETDRIPAHWVDPCNRMDEIWVPSEFNRRTFSEAGVSHLRVVPYALDTDFFRPDVEPLSVGGASGFCFLYVSELNWRKAYDVLLQAFLEEFRDGEDVSLILKTYGSSGGPEGVRSTLFRSVPKSVAASPLADRVIVLTEPLSQVELRSLYARGDLYISTDRANGWGMPCMEAMAMGVPCATVNWSGSTEFMHAENSLLIEPRGLTDVDPRLVEQRPDLYKGHRWADVDVPSVRAVLRRAFTDRERLKELGGRAAADIRERFSLEAVGRAVVRALSDQPPRAPGRPVLSVLHDNPFDIAKVQIRRLAGSRAP